jgi:DNA-binding Lrp family transcriptional regulator
MLTCDRGFSDKTLTDLKAIDGVKSAEPLYGVYDIVVTVEVPSMTKLEKTIISRIRGVKGVTHTLTMLVASRE